MQIQQGDVVFEYVEALPEGAEALPSVEYVVFAEGEATGHAHRASVKGAVQLFRHNDGTYARISRPIRVKHEEHKPVNLPPGIVRYGQVYEYDYLSEMDRQVID